MDDGRSPALTHLGRTPADMNNRTYGSIFRIDPERGITEIFTIDKTLKVEFKLGPFIPQAPDETSSGAFGTPSKNCRSPFGEQT